jgi:hypothetical protein
MWALRHPGLALHIVERHGGLSKSRAARAGLPVRNGTWAAHQPAAILRRSLTLSSGRRSSRHVRYCGRANPNIDTWTEPVSTPAGA